MAYSYVHTTSSIFRRGWRKQLLRPYVKKYLYSLINGFTQKQFGYDTMERCANSVKDFYVNLYEDEKLYVDSGGYSIIVGDVHPRDMSKFISVYNYFLEKHPDLFYRIFSLDIPIFLKYPEHNNVKSLYAYNRTSCIRSKEILDKNPSLYDKFVFVYQFKIKKQFDLWNKVYEEVFAKEDRLRHFALGGMVGLRGQTNIKFSPFIVPSYKLLDLIANKRHPQECTLHLLGVYGRHDRFAMIFMDKLFNEYYLKDHPTSVDISYDTINYQMTGLYRIRENIYLGIPPFCINEQKIYTPPEDLMRHLEVIIPQDQKLRELIFDETMRVNKGENISDTLLFSLTYVIYALTLDFMMRKIIEENKLLDIFLNSKNFNSFKNNTIGLLKNAERKYPKAIGNVVNNIMLNFQFLYASHQIWENGKMDQIDNAIYAFINHIGFPFDIDS